MWVAKSYKYEPGDAQQSFELKEGVLKAVFMLFPIFNAFLFIYSKLMLWGNERLLSKWDNQSSTIPLRQEDGSENFNSDEFTLKHVVSGADAYRIGNIQKISGGDPMAFELSTLRLPEAAMNIPGFKLRFDQGKREPQDSLGIASTSAAFTPKPNDFETIVNFAKMASDAYIIHSIRGDWKNMTDYTERKLDDFGWDGTGLRGYVFGNKDNSIIVISFKGTSTMFGGGDTVGEDKYIDNLMFSCCCARVDISWTPVCGCYMGSQRCNQTCLEESVANSEISYYQQAIAVVNLVKQRFGRAQLWFAGHSLGGAIAALMTVTFPRTAAITWESPGASLYGQRLGLHTDDPKMLSRYPIWNFGISTDPVYLGTCSGITTSCYLSGYAMETKCRQGQDCMFILKNRLVNINTHRIDWIIDHVLSKPDKYEMPVCAPPLNCTECEDWKFIQEEE